MKDALCSVCGSAVGIRTATFSWSDDSINICQACWPAYRVEHFGIATCDHCRETFEHDKGTVAPLLCPRCERLKYACPDCGAEIFVQPPSYVQGACPTCGTKRRVATFWKSIPPLYQDTVAERIPCQNARVAALAWADFPERKPGLLLFGETGGGKTRSLYLLGRRLVEQGLGVRVIKGHEFAKEVHERTRPGGLGDLGKFIEPLARTSVLLIDEADKIRLSERVELEFFDLFEHRLASNLAMVFTSNANPKEFAARFPKNAAPVGRRVYEFFQPIKFAL